MMPGWPNLTRHIQPNAAVQMTLRTELARVAMQLKQMTPQDQARALAKLGLPATAMALLEKLGRRLAKTYGTALEPDAIIGFLIAVLHTLGHISDAMRDIGLAMKED